MTLYSWGCTINGELGLGGIEEEQVLAPRALVWSKVADVEHVACGPMHTLLVMRNGHVYSCGNNDYGQLGHEEFRKRPQHVISLENHVITQATCGMTHSMAINEWGQLFTWGSNSAGQLGHEILPQWRTPKLVRYLATKNIVQIASGHYHNLALTNTGELYAWGANNYGQLGLGFVRDKVLKPTLLNSIAGIPISFIACGGNHSFAVSKSGAVFGWGKNAFGQLGINDDKSKMYPTQLKTLRSIGVRYIACGEDFSTFLTMDGGVFTCGAGNFGQLGHGNLSNEILPRMVLELMGTTCTQISCGKRHVLTFVPTRQRVYSFGLGGSGQLGNKTTNNATTPQVVAGPWLSRNGSSLLNDDSPDSMIVKRIFSGGDHSFVSTATDPQAIQNDCRIYDERTQIATLSVELTKKCGDLTRDETVDLEFMSCIEALFKSQACINGSFLLANEKPLSCTSKHSGVDLEKVEKAFDHIRKMENESLKRIIWDGITQELMNSLVPSPADVEALRIYLMLPVYHEFGNSKHYQTLHSPFSRAVLGLSKIPLQILSQWWANQSNDYFERLIENQKSLIMYILHTKFKKTCDALPMVRYESNLELALKLIALFFKINHGRQMRVPYDSFYLPELIECIDLQNDYVNWSEQHMSADTFHLCNYAFLFDAKAKTLLLQTDQALQMQRAMARASHTGGLLSLLNFSTEVSQFVVFNVTRENLVEDTIREIMLCHSHELKKPLKVKFHEEEAEDAGGVRKEFFMLLIKDLLDPKYGMFREFEDSRAIWFTEQSFESEDMFKLVGTLCGLAIYNFTIINLPFPLALYKKLLKEDIDMSDLKDLSPLLAQSMQNILDYDEADLEDAFDLTFEVTRNIFGEVSAVELKPGGAKIRVTQDNKKEFVELYIDYVFNKSVEVQFNGFYLGFMKVVGGRVMQLFRSHELMAVIVGNENYDWDALESNSQYKNGYASGDQTVRWFWEVFHELTLAEKKKFLLFLTGSDRIPIEGMKAIKIYFQPTSDDRCLPVAHTCFNLLDLPRYQTKERLKFKLLQAIQQTHGFSLV